MKIYLFFNKRKGEYGCINEKGQNILLENVVASGRKVDFLSNQMRRFENLKMEQVFEGSRLIILKDEHNNDFCSHMGNIPFGFTRFKVKGLAKTFCQGYQLNKDTFLTYKKIHQTDESVKHINEYLGEDYWGNIQSEFNRKLNQNGKDGLLKNLYLSAKKAMMRANMKTPSITNFEILTCENKQELERRIGCTKGEAQEGVSDINQQRYEYQADQECSNFLNELNSLLLQLDFQPAVKQTSPKSETKSQKQDRRM